MTRRSRVLRYAWNCFAAMQDPLRTIRSRAAPLALARVAPQVRVTVTPTLQHAIPRFSLHDVGGLFSFDAFLVRVLHAAG